MAGAADAKVAFEATGELAEGLDYAVVSKTIPPFGRRFAENAVVRDLVSVIQNRLSK